MRWSGWDELRVSDRGPIMCDLRSHNKKLVFLFCYNRGEEGNQSVGFFVLSFAGFLQPGKVI